MKKTLFNWGYQRKLHSLAKGYSYDKARHRAGLGILPASFLCCAALLILCCCLAAAVWACGSPASARCTPCCTGKGLQL